MNKQEQRTIIRRKRELLTENELNTISAEIAERVITEIPLEGKKILHLFLPIRRLHEVDTWLLKERILSAFPSMQFAISRMDENTGTLTHFLWEESTPVGINRLGIPEPLEGTLLEPAELDLVFVPLLCFDHQGNRIGYGKGFYDRFLAACRKDCPAIGISHFTPVAEPIIPDPWDVRLNYCVTPGLTYHFPENERIISGNITFRA